MLLHVALIIGCWSILSEGAENDIAERGDNKRPIWDAAHMVNSIQQIQDFVAIGANAIETDVSFDKNAVPEYTFHGVPCDCFRNCMNWEHFPHFLEGLRNSTTPGNRRYKERLVLVIFDLKSNGLIHDEQAYDAGKNLANTLLTHYWNGAPEGGSRAYIILSVPLLKHYKLFNGFNDEMKKQGREDLLQKVGYDFSGNDDVSDIEEAYKRAGINDHIWQSDGITNCIARTFTRVTDVIKARDEGGVIQKVYYWTADKYSTVRGALDAGVDSVMTNYPNVVVDVLKEDAYKDRFRFATIDDTPWEKYTP